MNNQNDDMSIGDNLGTVLTEIIESLEERYEDIEGIKEDKKAYYQELAGKKYPVKEVKKVISSLNRDEDKLKEEAANIAWVANALGKTVYCAEQAPNEGDEDQFLIQRVSAIDELESQRVDLQEEIKDILAQAKGNGFDVKILKICLKRRKDPEAFNEMDVLVDSYMDAIA